jgi:hypothetical protein
MHGELPLGPEAVANTEPALITEKCLPVHLKGVDADGEVHRVRSADVREPDQAVQERAISGHSNFGDVAVVTHAGVSASISGQTSEDPLITRGHCLMRDDGRGPNPVGGVSIDESTSGDGGEGEQSERKGQTHAETLHLLSWAS